MRTIRIGLLWHSANSGNLGVGALTIGNMAIARGVAAELGLTPEFTIFCLADRGRPYIDDAKLSLLTGKTMVDPRRYAAEVTKLDCMLDIGAGDSFTDIYGAKRFTWLILTKVWAIVRGVPLVFSPQTIGPFTGPAYRAAAAWTLRRARAVVVRDAKSAAAVRDITGREPVEAIDVAFALPWDPPAPNTGRPRIGINVSGLLWNGGYTGRSEFGLGYDYVALMRGLIEALCARGDVDIELIAHVNGDPGAPDGDGAVADAIAAEYPGVIRVPDFASPSAAKSHIAGLDALVAARMHACIAAFSSGVPVVPVSYSRKFEGLFGALGYARLVPHTGVATDAALGLILDALGQRETLRAEVAAGLATVTPKLDRYRAVLREVFAASVPRLRSG